MSLQPLTQAQHVHREAVSHQTLHDQSLYAFKSAICPPILFLVKAQ